MNCGKIESKYDGTLEINVFDELIQGKAYINLFDGRNDCPYYSIEQIEELIGYLQEAISLAKYIELNNVEWRND
jgi:hypothetical protein